MKRTLSHWKGLVATLRETLKRTTNRQMKAEYTRALRMAQRKVTTIERQVLSPAKWLLLIVLVYICGFCVGGCATMSGLGTDISNVSDGLASYRSAK